MEGGEKESERRSSKGKEKVHSGGAETSYDWAAEGEPPTAKMDSEVSHPSDGGRSSKEDPMGGAGFPDKENPWTGKKTFVEVVTKGSDVAYRNKVRQRGERIHLEERILSFAKSSENFGTEKEPIFDVSHEDEQIIGSRFRWVIQGLCKPSRPSLEATHQAVELILGVDRNIQIEAVNHWEILIRCSSEANFLKVLSSNFLQVGDSAIRLFRWSPGLNRKLDLRKVLVWFTISNLSFYLAHPSIFRVLLKPWGEYVGCDDIVSHLIRPSLIRV